jgi:hypothetical protein
LDEPKSGVLSTGGDLVVEKNTRLIDLLVVRPEDGNGNVSRNVSISSTFYTEYSRKPKSYNK